MHGTAALAVAQKTELGFSHGAHGLRHGYAQSRLATLRELGLSDKDAKQIISQEMGHFRANELFARGLRDGAGPYDQGLGRGGLSAR